MDSALKNILIKVKKIWWVHNCALMQQLPLTYWHSSFKSGIFIFSDTFVTYYSGFYCFENWTV